MKRLLLFTFMICLFMQTKALSWTDSNGVTWDYTLSDSYATITKSSKTTGDLVIPSSVNGFSVTSIGSSAFYGCYDLTSVTIPEGVTSIGEDAFADCDAMTSVVIPSSVTSIGNYAFSYCSILTSVYCYLETPLAITSETFSNRSNATLYVPDGCATAYKAAAYWKEFKNILVERETEENGIIWTYGVSGTNATEIKPSDSSSISGAVSIPSTIDGYTVTSIADNAFYGCTGLTSVMIPSSVTSIGSSAFEGCYGLTKVIIPDIAAWCGITFGSFDANPLYYACHLFSDENTEITDLVIPEGVTSIGFSAFSGCEGLTSVSIPTSVTSIGSSAFEHCYGLTTVYCYLERPLSITSETFSNRSNATLYVPDGCAAAYKAAAYWKEFKNILVGWETEENGISWTYSVSGTNATNIKPSDLSSISGEISIPSIIDGCTVTSIADNAFYGCSGLTSVMIPEGVTSIGNKAFQNCSNLTSVTIPEGVTSIGTDAFYRCSGLTSITIPESVTSIGDYAFYYCTGLTSVTIPEGVTSIGTCAFQGCSSLTKVIIPCIAAWCGITFGDSNANPLYYAKHLFSDENTEITDLVIPEGVTSIGKYAFYYCSSLTSVTIPSSVTSIGTDAFYRCSSLKKVIVPDIAAWCGITFGDLANPLYYAKHLFSDENTEITDLVIPESVTSISDDAFSYCTGLTSVMIPSSVTNIGSYSSFYHCSGLTTIIVANGNSVYDSRENCNAIIETATNTLILGCSNTVIPESVTSIGDYAFDGCSGLTSVMIPEGVTSIGKCAFRSCSGLTSITIPEGVTSIGDGAFYGCSGLSTVTINSNAIMSNRYEYSIVFSSNLGTRFSGVENVIIGEGVTSIGDYAFSGCSGLTGVTIPSSVTSIGSSAFLDCSDLTSVYCYLETPLAITSETFSNRSNATLYVPDGCAAAYEAAAYWKEFKNIVERETEENGISWTYSVSGTNATNIKPSDLSSISGEISIPTTIDGYTVTSIGNKAFQNCSNLTSVTIPEGVTSIGFEAFYGCTGLTSVTIPSSVTSIGIRAFSACSGLAKVIISDIAAWCGITYGNNTKSNPLYYAKHLFSDENTEITDLVIPEGVTSIGKYAICGCTGLTSVTIPSSVTSIASSSFYGCTGLKKVIVPDIAAWCGITFGNSNANPLYYAKHLFSDENTEITDMVIPEGVTSISDYAFYGCSDLTSVTIPSSVTSIGIGAFEGLGNGNVICEMTSPASISQNSFSTSSTIFVPMGYKETYQAQSTWSNYNILEYFVDNGFYYGVLDNGNVEVIKVDDTAEELVIPNVAIYGNEEYSVTMIGISAFSGCSGLTSVTIPESVTSICSGAFSGCTGLTDVLVYAEECIISGAAFSTETYNNAVLYVPAGTLPWYEAHNDWLRFKNKCEYDRIFANNINTVNGVRLPLSIQMDNTETSAGFQFVLNLPEDVTVVENNGNPMIALSERAKSLELMVTKLSAQRYLIAALSMGYEEIEGKEGAIVDVTVSIPRVVRAGVYDVTLKDITISTADGHSFSPSDYTVTMTVEENTFGDVNNDGVVNVTDALAIVNHVLNKPVRVFIEANADINQDGNINFTDALNLMRMILSGTASGAAPALFDTDQEEVTAPETQEVEPM